MEIQPKIELGKKTKKDILDALSKIKSEISEAKKRQKTAADVAADILASGGGPFAAAKEALSFKLDKTKRKLTDRLDPLNIINRATGSKLATAIAGRAMGRSEMSIRKAAGLQQRETQVPEVEESVKEKKEESKLPAIAERVEEDRKEESKVTRIENGKMITSLEFISRTLAVVARKVSDISDKLGATKKFKVEEGTRIREMVSGRFATKEMVETEKMQTDFLKNIWNELQKENILTSKFRDEQRDRAHTEKYKAGFEKRKAAIVKDTKPEEESGFGKLLSNLSSFLIPAFLPMAAAIAAVVAAFGLLTVSAKMVYDKWDDFKLSFSLLKDSLVDFGDTIVATVTKIKEWLGEVFTAGGDLIIDAGRSVVKGVKGLLGFKQTPEEEKAELEKEAAAGSGYAQRKLAKNVAAPEKVEIVANRVTEKTATDLSTVPQTAVTTETIDDGSLRQKALDSLMGVQAPTGTPEDRAAVGKVTRAVTETYGQLYKDDKGNPLRPSQDPERESRLPGVVDSTLKSLSKSLTQTQMVPELPKVSEVAPPAPRTGEMLTNAADMKADAAMQPVSQQITPVINNIRNSSVNNNTLHQALPNARSSESTFMRVSTRDFATS